MADRSIRMRNGKANRDLDPQKALETLRKTFASKRLPKRFRKAGEDLQPEKLHSLLESAVVSPFACGVSNPSTDRHSVFVEQRSNGYGQTVVVRKKGPREHRKPVACLGLSKKPHEVHRFFRVGEHLLTTSESVVHVVQTALDKHPSSSRHPESGNDIPTQYC